jgi:hypothetical protein
MVMRIEKIVKNNILVSQIVGNVIENFVIVNSNPVYVNKDKNLNGFSVEEYKKSPIRGLFYYVSYVDVLKLNYELLNKLKQ